MESKKMPEKVRPRLVLSGLVAGVFLLTLTACSDHDATGPSGVPGQTADATALVGPVAADGFGIPFEKFTLDNGLEVILHEDHSDPVVAVASIFHVGSNREEPGRTGFAHFFEHMSFNDSENVPRGANRKYIEELGGSRNGGTWSDGTVYYEVVPTDALEKIFWIDSDRMGFMINTVTEEALEREKQVVKNEKRQRVDNQPYGFTEEVLRRHLYPEGHPYSWTVIGSLDDLQNATLEDVKKFYEQYYGANNATLVVAGDFDPDIIKPLLNQWFGEIRRGPEVEALAPMPVSLDANISLWYPDKFAKLPELRRTWPTVEMYHPDSYPLQVLGQVLAGTKRSPLYRVLVEERKLAPSVETYSNSMELAGEFRIRVGAVEGTDLDEVGAAIEDGLALFESDGFPDSELQRIKAELETGFYQGISGVLNKAYQLANYNEYAGDPGFVSEDIALLQAVSRDDVMRVYEKYIQGRPYIQTSFVPQDAPQLAVEGSGLVEVSEEAIVEDVASEEVSAGEVADYERTPSNYDRSEPPLGPAPVLRPPDIWSLSLENGIEVLGIEDREVPLVEFSLIIPGGAWLDVPDSAGTAIGVANMLMQGTAGRTPAELEEAIGLLGSSIRFSADREQLYLAATSLERNLEQTLALVQEILLEPRWDELEFERLKREALVQIVAGEADPNSVAAAAFGRILYGDDNPYGRPVIGTRESVESLELEDLKNWYQANVKPGAARIQFAGALNTEQAKNILQPLAMAWQGEAPTIPVYEPGPAPEGGSTYFIDIPDAKQSTIRLGLRAVNVDDLDWVRTDFANQRLGAGSSSRLTQLLRIEKGYTYGAFSGLGQYQHALSPFVAITSVRSNATGDSLALIRDTLANYADTFTDVDAETTKNQVIKRDARSMETLGAKLGLLDRIARYNLPHDVIARDQEVLLKMDTAEFRRVISTYMDEPRMIWVVVGDGATQREAVTQFAGKAPIELDRQGAPVKQ
jgi:zinc protease